MNYDYFPHSQIFKCDRHQLSLGTKFTLIDTGRKNQALTVKCLSRWKMNFHRISITGDEKTLIVHRAVGTSLKEPWAHGRPLQAR